MPLKLNPITPKRQDHLRCFTLHRGRVMHMVMVHQWVRAALTLNFQAQAGLEFGQLGLVTFFERDEDFKISGQARLCG